MRVSWERFSIRTRDPFGISRGVRTGEERVWLRLEIDGLEGWGEADPSAFYGETADTVVTSLQAMSPLLEAAADPWAIESLESELRLTVAGHASAHAAVSAALHDLTGKLLGQPLWRIWERLSTLPEFRQAKWGGCKIKDSEFRALDSVCPGADVPLTLLELAFR